MVMIVLKAVGFVDSSGFRGWEEEEEDGGDHPWGLGWGQTQLSMKCMGKHSRGVESLVVSG